MSTLELSPPDANHLPDQGTPYSRFTSATSVIDQLITAQQPFTLQEYDALYAAKNDLRETVELFEKKGSLVDAMRAQIALAFADLTAHRGELITRRDEWRLPEAFKDLFGSHAFMAACEVASEGLELYEMQRHDKLRRRHIAGFLHELTALMIAQIGPATRFAVPACVHDDRSSSGFHFDIMLYDLSRPDDMRRAVDMKSHSKQDLSKTNSRFARILFANTSLQNNWDNDLWNNNPTTHVRPNFPTLRALIGEEMVESPIEVRTKLLQIHDDFYHHAFK